MRFGVLGCRHGHIETYIADMLRLGHEFVGICEKEGSLAPAYAEKYHVPLFTDEKSLFDLKPEMVGSSAINSQKLEIIKMCSLNGVHIMVDKPVVTNMEEYKLLEEIMNTGNIQVGLMLSERFNPPIYTLYEMIREGILGELISLTVMKPHKLMEETREAWHFSKKENGGIIIDLLIHDFDILRWFTGSEVDHSYGFAKKGGYGSHSEFLDSVQLAVKMKNGVTATLQADWWTPEACWTYGEGRIFCTGTLGKAEIRTTGDWMLQDTPFGILTTKDQQYGIYQNRMPPTVSETEDFLMRINGDSRSTISHEDILRATYASIMADKNVVIA